MSSKNCPGVVTSHLRRSLKSSPQNLFIQLFIFVVSNFLNFSCTHTIPVSPSERWLPAGLQHSSARLHTLPLAHGRFPVGTDVQTGHQQHRTQLPSSMQRAPLFLLGTGNLQIIETCSEAMIMLSPRPPLLCPQMGTCRMFNYQDWAEYGEITHHQFSV